MCNQYLLSDLRLQTRGSKAGAVLAASGAVLAALEPPRPRATQRRGALEQRWGSGTEVGLWAAPPRPGGAFRAPRGPCGNTIGLGAKEAPTLPLPSTSRQMRCDLGGRRRNHTCVDSPHVVVDGRGTAQPRHPGGRQIM